MEADVTPSGINTGWKRDMFIRARICPCDPTRGESCRLCDGTASDERERAPLVPPSCARCGHQPRGCPHCGRNDPILGGKIEDREYCHTFSDQPSCYTLNAWAVR